VTTPSASSASLYVQGRGALRRELAACLRTGRALRIPRARTRGRGKKFVSPEIMISERPAEVEDRAVPGHWEGDLILGLDSSAIGTLVERTTRFAVLLHLPRMEGHDQPRVKAFGLNRSELHTRQGLASGVTFPRVLGIEAAGVVAQCPGGEFPVGQQVVTMMGGMGRTFDGGYAEYTCVPASQVIPFASVLEWSTLGAVPEMLQTAYGSLTVGLDAQPGQSILIRGGTSSVGLAAAVLAKQRNMIVLSTTRSASKTRALTDVGVDHVLIDDGNVARQVREILPSGVDTALELVGTPSLPDTLQSTRQHGIVCFTGMLSNVWTVRDFYPIEYLPRGVRLTAYHGEADDLPQPVLQEFLDAVAAGEAVVPIDRVYGFDQIVDAHEAMEAGAAAGKLVVTT
jgi:NADPH:quinone reductase-like Zn-dependent oxidoreductase